MKIPHPYLNLKFPKRRAGSNAQPVMRGSQGMTTKYKVNYFALPFVKSSQGQINDTLSGKTFFSSFFGL